MLTINTAFGRFTGPTIEHEKLLDRLLDHNKPKISCLFVMGAKTINDITLKDPLTVVEKVSIIQRLYPFHSIIPGVTQQTHTPNQAMVKLWHAFNAISDQINLNVYAGDGGSGGSAQSYEDILDRLNGTRFPVRQDADGNKYGGDYRMNYHSYQVISQPRGTVSGSLIRQVAVESDDIDYFKSLLHSRMTYEMAGRLMLLIKERSRSLNVRSSNT